MWPDEAYYLVTVGPVTTYDGVTRPCIQRSFKAKHNAYKWALRLAVLGKQPTISWWNGAHLYRCDYDTATVRALIPYRKG